MVVNLTESGTETQSGAIAGFHGQAAGGKASYRKRYVHKSSKGKDKRFSCEVCGKAFRDSCALADHMRTHTGDRPFSCSVCNAKFRRKHHLSVHLTRKHTAKKPFSCSVRQLKFSDRSQTQTNTFHARRQRFALPQYCSGTCTSI